MEDHLIALEKQVTHQGYQLEQLSDALKDQASLIERLEKELSLIKSKLEEELIDPERTEDDDQPPHY